MHPKGIAWTVAMQKMTSRCVDVCNTNEEKIIPFS